MTNYKVIFKIILCIVSMFLISHQFELESINYSIFFVVFTILLLYFVAKNKTKLDKRENSFTVFTSIVSSILLSFGTMTYKYEYLSAEYRIFSLHNLVVIILYFVADFIISYYLFGALYKGLKNVKVFNQVKKSNKHYVKVFFISFLIIFLCYIPYFLRCYPAIMTPDSYVQISLVEEKIFANHHPFIQTQFFGVIYKLGKLIFKSGNMAVGFYIIVQMIIMSLIFSSVVSYLYKKNVNKWIILLTIGYYALSPLHAFYSVTLWKDVLFGANFALLLLIFLNINENGFTIKNTFMLIVALLILLFFRNNGIFILILMTPFLIALYKSKKKVIIPVCLGLISFYFVLTGPIYKKIGVLPTNPIEALSIPIQQMANVIASNQTIDAKSSSYFNELFDIEFLKSGYSRSIADNAKNSVNSDVFNNSKTKFFKSWLNLLIQHPTIYVESYLTSTCGYWYPDVEYPSIGCIGCETEEYNGYKYGIKNEPKVSTYLRNTIDKSADKSIPFSILIWGTGLYCYLLFLSSIIFVYLNGFSNKNIICYITLLSLWLTLMVSSPVFAELRYIYGVFTCLPLILIIPFLNAKDANNEKVNIKKKQKV